MRIEILDEAEKDLVEGFAFYERQSNGLGDYFLDSIFSDVESLHLYAGIHGLHFGYHRLLAKRFPFAIYYRVQNNVVRVYAILDCRRNPAWVRHRLA
ncbi:MAG: type II toxin-antitoxin system RelE/ParE family toxin [Desulfobacterales bacterium]|nr:type II toxin-antitoxin system RelE/ParE family toxin [Desulfobacterales bacterium]